MKSAKNLVPLLDRVLVQRVKANNKTASGLFIPEQNVQKLNQARVIAVGPGFTDANGNKVTPAVDAGDIVLLPEFGGTSIKIGEDEYLLFRDQEILAKISE